MKSPTGVGGYGMLLYEIKVLLGFLVCSVTNTSNALSSFEMYSEMQERLWEPASKIALTIFVGTENNSIIKWKMDVGSLRFVCAC